MPNSRFLISIIIPVYNNGSTLLATLASIQEDARHEIILVDDGSEDAKTRSILRELSTEHTVIHQAHSGTARARNRGSEQARGSYLLFLDADDLLEKNFATTMLKTLQNHPEASFTYPNTVLFGSEVGLWDTLSYDHNLLRYYQYFLINSLMKREMFEQLSGFNTDFPYLEDREFWVRSSIAGLIGIKTPVFHFYRQHQRSKTARVNRTKMMNQWETSIKRTHRSAYSWYDYLNKKVVFYSLYIRLFFLIPAGLKRALKLRALQKALRENPKIIQRFPQEVVHSFKNHKVLV